MKLNAGTDADMLRCFTLRSCDVNVALKQLHKDRCLIVTEQLLTMMITVLSWSCNVAVSAV